MFDLRCKRSLFMFHLSDEGLYAGIVVIENLIYALLVVLLSKIILPIYRILFGSVALASS